MITPTRGEAGMGSLLICDLDGTLVDSFPGIAAALRQALAASGMQPAVPIGRWVIGPPLDDVLAHVVGGNRPEEIETLRRSFMSHYDGAACRLSSPFDGIDAMLESLLARDCQLALATNKRMAPTMTILEERGWRTLFGCVETVDSREPPGRSKAMMLQSVLETMRPSASVYLGDTQADVDAADAAGLPCLVAGWGYGRATIAAATAMVAAPREVPDAVDSLIDALGRRS